MWDDLRESRGSLYGWLLYQAGIVPWGRHWFWLPADLDRMVRHSHVWWTEVRQKHP